MAVIALNGIIPCMKCRCLQNFCSKWLDSSWVHAASRRAASLVLAPRGGAADAGSYPVGDSFPCVRVHCLWNQTATATGRLSSSNPNLQGRLLMSADYSQIELFGAFLHTTGIRFGVTRKQGGLVLKENREKAKRVVYAILYGQGPRGLSGQLCASGMNVDVAAASKLINLFLNHFCGAKAFMDRALRRQGRWATSIEKARTLGYVSTLLGRRRPILGLGHKDAGKRGDAERKVVNSTVQGSAADLVKIAMVDWSEK
eukprot:gene20125-26855_t